jgi:hypothetical protein
MGAAAPYFIPLDTVLLYLNLYAFRRKILVRHVIGAVQVIWPETYLSENNSFLPPVLKDCVYNIFLM